jgi:hypothetical protein
MVTETRKQMRRMSSPSNYLVGVINDRHEEGRLIKIPKQVRKRYGTKTKT